MKCTNCKTELFNKDVVQQEQIGINGQRNLTYRCPKCFKVKKVKE